MCLFQVTVRSHLTNERLTEGEVEKINIDISYLSGSLSCFLQTPAISCPSLGHITIRGDEEVVKEDIIGHGPELQTDGAEWSHTERVQVLKEVWVRDLPGLPHSLSDKQAIRRLQKKAPQSSELSTGALFKSILLKLSDSEITSNNRAARFGRRLIFLIKTDI